MVRILSTAGELVRSVLNLFAGLFHVLAEAVSRVAADADNGQEGGDKQRKNEPLGRCNLMGFHGVIIESATGPGAMGGFTPSGILESNYPCYEPYDGGAFTRWCPGSGAIGQEVPTRRPQVLRNASRSPLSWSLCVSARRCAGHSSTALPVKLTNTVDFS